ncbi:MAG: AsmA family protein, partial [Hyphomonadaceae bacterium]
LLLAAFALFLALADWNALRGPVSGFVGAAIGRPVRIAGDLDVDLVTWRPRFSARDVVISNPAWAGPGENARIGAIGIETRWLGLLSGRPVLTRVDLERPAVTFFRAEDGRATWKFAAGTRDSKPLRLPPIQRFMLRDGRLRIDDRKRGLRLDAAVASTETAGAQRPFQLHGRGVINGEPFLLDAAGAPLLQVERGKPYAFHADIRAGVTRAAIDGAMRRPFDLSDLQADLRLSGPDLSDLYLLTGVTLPNTPPYRLSARMTRKDQRFAFSGIAGVVGDSDLAGALQVSRRGERPFLTADLRSRQLDFDDLAAVLGAPPGAGAGETASPQQAAAAARMRAEARLLPDAPLRIDRVRRMDAHVRYAADSVRTSTWPLRQASVVVDLDRGVLKLAPVSFALPRGQLTASVRIDARQDTPDVDVDARLARARIEDFMAKSKAPGALAGSLEARAQLRGRGASVHEAAATAAGRVTLVAPRGEIRAAFAELLGVNIVRGLGLLLAKDQSTTPIRCAVADFRVQEGVLHGQNIVLDTGIVLAAGQGAVSLRDETLDLSLKGHPKKPRLVRVMAPITVKGKIRAPKLGVDAGQAAGQLGAAAALGALLSPLAAVLPFVDPGLADDADCASLLAEAKIGRAT